MYLGDVRLGVTIDFKFTTRSFSTGAPTQLAGSPVISAYVDNGTTQITAGITLTVDFDAVTGLNNVRAVLTGGNGYATGTNIDFVITTGTVGGVSVVGEVVGRVSIETRSALMPTTTGRTLDVSATGEADANVVQWLGTAAATPTVAGVPEVDITHIGGAAQSATDLKDFADDGYDPATNKVQGVVLVDTLTATVSANVIQISGDTTAADTLESYLDGTDFMPVDAHKPNFTVVGSTLTVKKPDGTTTAHTKTVTTDAAADPITGAS